MKISGNLECGGNPERPGTNQAAETESPETPLTSKHRAGAARPWGSSGRIMGPLSALRTGTHQLAQVVESTEGQGHSTTWVDRDLGTTIFMEEKKPSQALETRYGLESSLFLGASQGLPRIPCSSMQHHGTKLEPIPGLSLGNIPSALSSLVSTSWDLMFIWYKYKQDRLPYAHWNL